MTTETKPKSKAQEKRERVAECLDTLRKLLPPGATVHTTVTHVARSGMSRRIALYVIIDNEPRRISATVADVLGYPYHDKDGAIAIGGCGMDMGFAIVHSLSYKLHPEGFDCVESETARCPSSDHANRVDTRKHTTGGYSLFHRWL